MNNFHMREGKVEFRWKRWRNKKRQEVSSCLMVLFSGAVLLGAGGVALAGPTGGQVTGGQGTITNPNGTTTNINQQSNVLNINWQDFSIQQGETVNFYQPGSTSVAINRVVGGVPSYLAGALNANGRVFILNSAGITFTGTSQVNVGALLATTAMTVNGDPTQAASYSGSGYGAVINQGSISVSNGGFAILAAPYVQNTGFIKADLGTIALAGTNQFTLDLSGTGLINFVVPAGAVEKIVSDGKAVGVDNAGTLQARSGQVLISANVASEVINAVVNLNGIVDADAFAANGQGGAVLVTAAGDINVGGQVTAKGSGAGNGGQILTKAIETDNIGQMAFVSARGGAAGEGGLIEVSGKNVGLNGAIDPGKGGLLYIDPLTFTIRNATSGQGTNFIGEHKLEALLQNGAGFLVNVAGNITIQDLSDNVLAGGAGDLTLHAGTGGAGNIIVQGVGDIIRTGSGDVTLTAAGNIGDSSHALSFVSGGANLSGVSQAGDIILTTTNGGNIYVNSVTERAAGPGTRHALFSANAAGLFTAEGLIDLQVRANGVGTQSADAEVHIAANQIRLAGINVLANATKHASSGSNAGGSAFANAIVTLNGTQASDDGAMTVAASVAGSSGFRFHANAQLIVNEQTGFHMKGGPISVMARANAFSAGTSGVLDNAVLANAGLSVNGSGPVDIDSLGVHATALGDKVANDVASAHADLNGNDIHIFGNASVTANGQAGPNGAALVVANASMNATGTAVNISSNVTVTAEANNPDLGRGASATADLRLVAVSNTVTVGGDITVNAVALNDGSSFAEASAALVVTGDRGIDVDGNVTVFANALTLADTGTDKSTPRATASASFTVNDGNIRIGGGLDVEANISSNNFDTVVACAQAHLRASGSGAGSIEIDGATKVIATARTNAHTGFFSPSGALASASLSVHAEGHVSMDTITVKATADSLGEFKAHAIAVADISATSGSVTINGPIDVEANARDNTPVSFDVTDPHGASASANLFIHAEGEVTLGDVTVKATANDLGHGYANAQAIANINATTSFSSAFIRTGNVDVEASAQDALGNGAKANAQFLAQASSGVFVGSPGSDGPPRVANLTVSAIAGNGGTGNASAIAHASLDGVNSKFAPVGVFGNVSVTANAHDTGGGNALASALATFIGGASFSGAAVQIGALGSEDSVIGGHLHVEADAVDNGGNQAIAVAAVNITADTQFGTPSGVVHVLNGIDVVADANHTGAGAAGGTAASANAQLHFNATSLEVDGATLVQAHATNNGAGKVKAQGAIAFSSASTVTLGDVTIDVKALNLGSNGSGGAKASANFIETDASVSLTLNSLNLQAQASTHGGGNAIANAIARITQSSLSIPGDITINALAFRSDPPAPSGSANALASLDLRAGSSDLHVGGDIKVTANAVDQNSGLAQANAHALLASFFTIHVDGGILVSAEASGHGKAGAIAANANAQLIFEDASNVIVGGDMSIVAHGTNHGQGKVLASGGVDFGSATAINLGPVLIDVRALNLGTGGTGGANANAQFSIGSGVNLSIKSLNLQAQASSFGPSNAHALASANIAPSGSLTIGGDVTVNALAVAHGGGNALAQANLLLTASSGGDLTVSGDIDVHANANAFGAGQAQANAIASLTGGSSSSGLVNLGGVNVIANALHSGAGAGALALAKLTIDPSTVTIAGDVNVEASANNLNGFAGGLAASANAVFNVSASSTITITGDVTALAHATNHGKGRVLATGNINISSASTIDLAGVTIDVAALNIGTDGNAGTGGAIANAIFHAGSSHNLSLGALNLQAQASSLGGGNALALASGNISQSHVVIDGDVTVNALAVSHGGGGNAVAVANLLLTATSGSLSVSGDIDVHANANAAAGGEAQANAIASLVASSIEGDGGPVKTGSINVIANALHSGSGGPALTLAKLMINGSSVSIDGSVNVKASANNLGGRTGGIGASANALFSVAGASSITVSSDISVVAHATNNGKGRVLAQGNIQFDSSASTINLAGVTIDVAALNKNSQGTGGAVANAIFLANGSSVNLHIDALNLQAQANSAGAGNALALASGKINDGRLDMSGALTVNAAAFAQNGNAQACAIASLAATTGSISVDSVHVTASAVDNGNGAAKALAEMTFDPSSVHVTGDLIVHANASHNGAASPGGLGASANANLNFLNTTRIEVDGLMSIAAHGTNHGAGRVNAFGNVNFSTATSIDLQDVVIDVRARNLGSGGVGGARAIATFTQGGANTVTIDSLNLQAQATSHGTGNAFASADGQLHQNALLSIPGDITVNAVAVSNNDNASALANLGLSASTGTLTLGGNVRVMADASGNGGDVLANALTFLQAEDRVNVAGNIEVDALANGGSQASGNVWAITELRVDAFDGSISIGGNVDLHGNAQHPNSEGGAGVFAHGNLIADDGVAVDGNISVTAELKSNAINTGSASIGGVFFPDKLVLGFDLAGLLVDNLGTGDVSIGGGVEVVANAEFDNPALGVNVFGRASAFIEARSGDVAIGGPVFVQGKAKSAGNASGTVFGSANFHALIFGASGSVHVGDVTVEATASATGANAGQQACAFGDLAIGGGVNGDVSAGLLSERVEAVYLGSHANDAFASANMFVTATGGNVHIQGARLLADGDVLESGGDATAKAEMRLFAGGSLDVGAGGLFADADAFAADGGHADANALIAADAGQDGIGGVFIHGNAIVIAGAIGGDTGNTALANVHLAGGNATEFGTGASGIFGNVAVIGNIQAFAAADSLHDHANASVEIFAHNNILIIGDDPIASARLGPNGSLVAFRQAHFTTNQSVTGTQGTATADIDIRAGDQVLVFPPSSLVHVEKLFAMPTDTPTLNSSGGLTIIPLSIINDDCGVLGQAGLTQAQIDKAKSCHKGPINVSDLTDVLP